MSLEPEPHPDLELPDEEISLEELTAAFAQAMGYQPASEPVGTVAPVSPPGPEADAPETAEPVEPVQEPPLEPAREAAPVSPGSILEAMLFVGKRNAAPLTAQEAADLMRGVEPSEIHALVDGLNRRYDSLGAAFHIVNEGAGYRLTLRDGLHGLREGFYGRVREARLSQAAVDVLAIVAYRQPVTADEVSQVRGRAAAPILTQLVRRQLLRIERPETGNQTPRYRTTGRFLELFRLGSLGDLPQSEDVDQL